MVADIVYDAPHALCSLSVFVISTRSKIPIFEIFQMSSNRPSHYSSPLLLDILTALLDAGDRALHLRITDGLEGPQEYWHLASHPLTHDNSGEQKHVAMGAATSVRMSQM